MPVNFASSLKRIRVQQSVQPKFRINLGRESDKLVRHGNYSDTIAYCQFHYEALATTSCLTAMLVDKHGHAVKLIGQTGFF